VEDKTITEKYESSEEFFKAIKKAERARKEELLNLLHTDGYRYEALKSLGKAETEKGSLDPEQEAMYYVALAQVFAILELVETLKETLEDQ
jgi:hypothetical protein